MARARPAKKRASAAGSDTVTLLKRDHREVANLIDQVEDAEGDELPSIAERICQLLTTTCADRKGALLSGRTQGDRQN
jgi:hypothetical protein